MRDISYCLTAYKVRRFRFCWAFDTLAEAQKKGIQYVREGAGRSVEITRKTRVIWARGVTKTSHANTIT